ncbi:hypothetical protein BU26DRAFT_160609 [Trematosphaeria pertusa]|uniref:Uncharacterized protein n=1 Tax=Trematosphaeria pertusa TaxID=390896 RepID=A0A6A6HW28_9PLEO|nr:uncharacterized protein BU26DRAFT_160609 [Trematosphaeria pertusa]KAF2242404.1 hypothetical protein BU26DRAFT_160609 [Trematosphaeria pertusa]
MDTSIDGCSRVQNWLVASVVSSPVIMAWHTTTTTTTSHLSIREMTDSVVGTGAIWIAKLLWLSFQASAFFRTPAPIPTRAGTALEYSPKSSTSPCSEGTSPFADADPHSGRNKPCARERNLRRGVAC